MAAGLHTARCCRPEGKLTVFVFSPTGGANGPTELIFLTVEAANSVINLTPGGLGSCGAPMHMCEFDKV